MDKGHMGEWYPSEDEPIMNSQQRLAVAETLNRLLERYEEQYDLIERRMEREIVPDDFYELLYDVLYEFSFDEITLLARVMKLLETKSLCIRNKIKQNGYN